MAKQAFLVWPGRCQGRRKGTLRMTNHDWTGTAVRLRWIVAQLRRPELMVFVPALTLAAFWLGGIS